MRDADPHNAKVVDQFTRWAERFSKEPLHAEPDAMQRLLAAVAPQSSSRVLDVACGPGIVACALARYAAKVTGVDLTAAMLEEAKLRQEREGLTNLTWMQADATELPFGDECFDVVVTRYSFHHMRQPEKALSEMRRVCRAGGRVVVVDATPTTETQLAYDAMETLRDPSHASALTVAQIRHYAKDLGLKEVAYDFHWLEAALEPLADQDRMGALTAVFNADIESGADLIGVKARRTESGIRFSFPISVFAWLRD
ncbi:ubiquinone/menaquinone biosynthesis C-methylase UbiE [Rhizomicrobium palustre]|uniref:Ubiquinone/menaquinone biosynthesis C-methylase UbiE n=1 Tax=Rhizomicrobium palustre TaxID=189966 RepID=A0A846N232_9PROT|nr:methyltransferase domain-containing protein [Rhizomicrobium palustre]NIK89673.1 ubiquinone/menaquinone biosynthesis C-methylase UbiE [Rhizomicrobium palustre]